MTNEELIQEILYEAHEHGLMSNVLEVAKNIIDNDPKIDRVLAYEKAFQNCLQEK